MKHLNSVSIKPAAAQSQAAPHQPSERGRTSNRDQTSPEERSAAGGADRSQIKIGADQFAVIFSEVAVELGYLDKFGRLGGQKGTYWTQPGSLALALRPHVSALLRGKFRRRIIGHDAHDLC